MFLVDGLSVSNLESSLVQGSLKNIQGYFLTSSKKVSVARTGFPSVTYPAIASLLTESPVSQHGIYGNRIIHQGELVNFEKPENFNILNQKLNEKNIFSRLAQKGYRTVSLAYGFQANSLVHTESLDLKAALAYQGKDYAYIDNKTLESLRLLLRNTPTQLWPEFVFVHLVGVDLVSHDQGADSQAVKQYLKQLDSQLGPIFEKFKKVERSGERRVVSFLTSDHGYDKPVKKIVDLERTLLQLDSSMIVLNEGRYLAVYFPQSWSLAKRSISLKTLADDGNLEFVAHKYDRMIDIYSQVMSLKMLTQPTASCLREGFSLDLVPHKKGITIKDSSPRLCPEQMDGYASNLFTPFFFSSLAHYFQASNSPDAIVMGKSGVSFARGYKSIHGGLTPQEMLVPVLMRNADFSDKSRIPHLYEILSFL